MKRILFLTAFLGSSLWAMDTYVYQIDPDSFTAADMASFATLGTINDPEPFHRTYLVQNSTEPGDFYTYKVTPKSQKEENTLIGNLGKGFTLVGVYDLSGGLLKIKQDKTDSVPVTKKPTATADLTIK